MEWLTYADALCLLASVVVFIACMVGLTVRITERPDYQRARRQVSPDGLRGRTNPTTFALYNEEKLSLEERFYLRGVLLCPLLAALAILLPLVVRLYLA